MKRDIYDHEYEREYKDLAYPITCESYSLDGKWILVMLLTYLGKGKWAALDEDGQEIVVDSASLSKPRL